MAGDGGQQELDVVVVGGEGAAGGGVEGGGTGVEGEAGRKEDEEWY